MSTNNYNIRGLLNIKDENISFEDNFYFKKKIKGVDTHILYGVLSYVPKACPKCGSVHCKSNIIKNGFKASSIKLLPISGLPAILKLKKQRFICRSCDSTFIADTHIVEKDCYIATSVKNEIFLSLMSISSFKDLASRFNVSSHTVTRVLRSKDKFFMPRFNDLPQIIAMDEFKSVKNVDSAMSYICSNPITNEIVDVLPDRRLFRLKDYFSRYSLKERESVSFVICDMYAPYLSLTDAMFPNAEVIVDRFHVIQNFSRAFNQTRIKVMKNYDTDSHEYRCLKRYWKLLLKYRNKLDSINFKPRYCFKRWVSEAEIVDHILEFDPDLRRVYEFLQGLLTAIKCDNFNLFKTTVQIGKEKLKHVEKISVAIKTAEKYEKNIENALSTNLTNGGLEGIINKIKVIKRVSFGYRNFLNLRMRILLSFYKFNMECDDTKSGSSLVARTT